MAKKGKILIVEDDQFLRMILEAKLKRERFEVETAVDGDEAIKKIKAGPPDFVLLDLILPKISGFEVLEEIKMDAGLRKIPVVILSNLGQEEDIERAKELGAQDYLVKVNLSIDQVIKKVREWMARRK